MAKFVSDEELPGSDDREKKAPAIPPAWFTAEFKEDLKDNAGQWGLLNNGKLVDRSYFNTKLRKQAVRASADLGGKVIVRFEYEEQKPKTDHVITRGEKKGQTTTVYLDQGRVWAKFIEGESYDPKHDLAEVWNKNSKGKLELVAEAATAPPVVRRKKAAAESA